MGRFRRSPKAQPRPPIQRKRVVSAGGVVLRNQASEVLLITLRGGEVWSLPKGRVEALERYAETAVREVLEETGIDARVVHPLGSVRYHFTVRDDGPTAVTKEVQYFLMAYRSGEARPQQEEVDGVAWVAVGEAKKMLSYANEREMLLRGLARWEAQAALGAPA